MSQSYEFRIDAEPRTHKVYNAFIGLLLLKNEHLSSLKKRGLSSEHIHKAGYVTKENNNANNSQRALGQLDNQFNLDDIAGFFIGDKTGYREQSRALGLIIPVRDYNGKISSILIRNDNPKTGKNGKVTNKYFAFSSNGKSKGAKVWQTTHCPIVRGIAKDVSGTTIRITEGILKADVTTALDENIYCLGTHGLNIQNDLKQIIDELEISELLIALDAGEDKNSDMIRAKAKLIMLTKELGIDVQVEIWDPKYGKGIDDVLLAGHKDKIKRATPEEIDELLDTANSKDPANGDWIYCIGNERFIHVDNFIELKKTQFVDKFSLVETRAASMLIGHNIVSVDKLTFAPTQKSFTYEDGQSCFNIWRDPQIIPMKGDIKPFMDHIKYLISDGHEHNILLDWMAYNIQHPGTKIMWALVIIGGTGIGKSYIGEVMKNLVGEYNISCPTNEEIHEIYTGWQKGCQLVIIEELMARGRLDLMNKLKPIITQPMTRIREMHTPTYNYPNRTNILAFTNYDDALRIDDDDRRYCVLKSNAKQKDENYYNKLWNWTKEPKNIQALLHYFISRDISSFNPHARAPVTEAKRKMVEISRTQLEEWIINGIADQCWPFNHGMVAVRHLQNPEVYPRGMRKPSDFKCAAALQKAGAIKYTSPVSLSDKSRVTLWVFGSQKDILLGLSPSDLGKVYESNVILNQDTSVNPLEDIKPI